ncbi:winged helix-turn-helix transcriptional regulator [Rhodobacter capsulatus]|uniref:MarR family winged helix-turn-helix transcriptional regulator n=1 Tax=Rhodobacter capsulatus TaxID=1061 RepID=UPI0006DC618C|nr:MarR family winged helix-turn-helix transcriptional regulator [Rhodobacter capsulatus]KQB12980.1 MarR family transcriptional regulator [Rhodobacter capsulatus]KQB15837.1 MarR family transcriptional regulator [Rhodobacter capsulatus]PZX28410.1 DNA-binding MarR family transcriptional regulator [Rhodobacter capsulatus]QNR62694.1 winged helix-turn-helix transcriptional regulator [Rhodobacter capsulatus]
MHRELRSEAGEALTALVLELFRVNNLLLAWGDRLVAPLGLTSARWQVLGAVVVAAHPQPVAWLARDLGASRQNVQRIVNDLAQEGLVTFAPNPHHKRAQLVVLTDKGAAAAASALGLYDPQVNALAEGLSPGEIAAANRLLAVLKARLTAAV